MGNFFVTSQPKKLSLLLNIAFLCLLSFYLTTSNFLDQKSQEPNTTSPLLLNELNPPDGCTGFHDYTDYKLKCLYVKTHIGCRTKGYINYLFIFYCTCGKSPILGHSLLLLWLIVLFYLLGNTAANYFCESLESLSKILKLSPTIAGVTLLSLGNGASDVFASIVSFTNSSNGDVGLNSVLGGAIFVSSVVVGVICMLISPQNVSVDKPSFIRDVIFFLFSLSSLLLIIFIGKISLWGSICFVSIYFLYVSVVSTMYIFSRKERKKNPPFVGDLEKNGVPLLGFVDDEKPISVSESSANLDHQNQKQDQNFLNLDSSSCGFFLKFLKALELPLYLPRRLTIPVVSEERWSKPYAVISVTLAPILLATICNSQGGTKFGSRTSLVSYFAAGLTGMVLGSLACMTTKKSSRPSKCLLPWLASGFVMSITWTYIIAEELVSLLVSIGYILGISPSVLGLTVLAWGNSLNDLITNVAMAVNGGPNGAQVAISGCYAGPMFNTLMGIGISLVFSSWAKYPACYEIPRDPSLYDTLGFLIGGLLWALVVLPRKNMRLGRVLGIGLLAIYLCFLFLRLAKAVGLLKLDDVSFINKQ
ncbi:cation/calcium exchanger 1-like [Tripterygium wilfordii]|uniref:Cation/calcium exchanger 1-like n=1 Tax=Tripterygium wilfordii TaxID=458696 RepID=A0A7J7BV33_TRIWF|nr:cation/calcium exchanger 1-like [Tripterygium wilfordii]KAF5725750.1 cation/calcium exchanger 1-like [Tripterygium wilfordii]